ncbi:conserved hypothetical protein [Desulfosarcina cetonica]|nr:conserved hypothetical protein [Desulfosarcina cetonica]
MQLSEFSQTGNLLTLVVRAPIDKRRFRAICRDMDQAVPALGTVRIVIVMRHYPTFNSAEDFLDDLRFLRLYEHAIEAVAVVCDRSWKDSLVGLFSLFSGIRMDFFSMDQPDALTAWAQGA